MRDVLTLILAGVNSQAAIVETFAALEEGVYFTNGVTEIVMGEGAVIDHTKVQRESKNAFHITTQQVHQDRASNFSSHSVILGGALGAVDQLEERKVVDRPHLGVGPVVSDHHLGADLDARDARHGASTSSELRKRHTLDGQGSVVNLEEG